MPKVERGLWTVLGAAALVLVFAAPAQADPLNGLNGGSTEPEGPFGVMYLLFPQDSLYFPGSAYVGEVSEASLLTILFAGPTVGNLPFPDVQTTTGLSVDPDLAEVGREFLFLGGGSFPGFSLHVLEGVKTVGGSIAQAVGPIDQDIQDSVVAGLLGLDIDGVATDVSFSDFVNALASAGELSSSEVQDAIFDGEYSSLVDAGGGAVSGEEWVFAFEPFLSGKGSAGIGADGSVTLDYQPVPEPAAVLTVLVGIGGLAWLRRRRRKAA